METFKVNLSWDAFEEILDKHPRHVLDDINAGFIRFADAKVTLQVPLAALCAAPDTPLH
ncbi:MAG TPA: hypothetical protein VGB25_09440 [Candidatus Binatia bacterium]